MGDQIAEAIMLHQRVSADKAFKDAVALLDRVGIPSPDVRALDYPHQLSGGMRQRVMIAMAVSCRPKVLIADEPTTALDVTVQAQIFDLLNEIQRDFGAAIVLITHDMGAISEMADRVAVMYAGRIVETGATSQVLTQPSHPYTHGLLGSIPGHGQRGQPLLQIPGMAPNMTQLPEGCAFASRCESKSSICLSESPNTTFIGEGRSLRCHHPFLISKSS